MFSRLPRRIPVPTATAYRFLSAAREPTAETPLLSSVYVHYVSKTVLQHLQDHQSEWLIRNRLDEGLTITDKGTFVLAFPQQSGRIWTSFDATKKQHWISVDKRGQRHSFLLKDASMLDKPYPYYVVHQIRQQIAHVVNHMVGTLEEKS